MASDYRELAGYRRCVELIDARWPDFQQERRAHLAQQARFDKAPEKVAENIVGALFTSVLGWSDRDLNWQLQRADLVVTHNFAKYLVVETKHPGKLNSRKALDDALDQAWRYAQAQRVQQVAVCDGFLFYGADIGDGGLRPRICVELAQPEPPRDALWWVSMDGIYRPCETPPDMAAIRWPDDSPQADADLRLDGALLHPKYKIPAHCFAYVGDPEDTATWKLPYRLADGRIDLKRLPKAAQALISNYRGVKVGGIPDETIPAVFRRLGEAAAAAGKLPAPGVTVAAVYQQLAQILDQLAAAGK